MTLPNAQVSIVIPTKNSARSTKRLLQSIKVHASWCEVIVVDCCSDDGTRETAECLGVKFVESRVGRSEARNIGAQTAGGRYVLFLDSDMELDSDIASECIAAVQRDKADAVVVPELTTGNGVWNRVRRTERLGYREGSAQTSPAFLRRDVFLQLGGFDPLLLAGEDYDFDLKMRRNNLVVTEIQSVILHNEDGLNFAQYMKKSFSYGKYLRAFILKNPSAFIERFFPIRPGALSASTRLRPLGSRPEFRYVILVPFFKLAQAAFALTGMIWTAFPWTLGSVGRSQAGRRDGRDEYNPS